MESNGLGKAVRKARESAGRTQVQVANLLGVSTTYYSFFENGRNGLTEEQLAQVAEFLGIPVRPLLVELARYKKLPAIAALLEQAA